jgi:hypothetical protein
VDYVGRRLEEAEGKYDQSTLYICMKCHNEVYNFVQLTHANKMNEQERVIGNEAGSDRQTDIEIETDISPQL